MEPSAGLFSRPAVACSPSAEPCVEDEGPSALPERGQVVPLPWSWAPCPNWPRDEHVQAKRARVETIVRAMCLPANPLGPANSRAGGGRSRLQQAQGRRRKQQLPVQQGLPLTGPRSTRQRRPRVREQLHLLRQQLTHLQEHVLRAAGCGDSALGSGGPLSRSQMDVPESWAGDSEPHQSCSRDLPGAERHGGPSLLPGEAWSLLQVLRGELARALDSALHRVLLDPSGPLTQLDRTLGELQPEGRSRPPPPEGDTSQDPLPLALPQVGGPRGHSLLARPQDAPQYPVSPMVLLKPLESPPASCPTVAPPHTRGQQVTAHGCWRAGLCPPPSSEPALQPWGATGLRPSVLSRHQTCLPLAPLSLKSLPLPTMVKREQGPLQGALNTPSFHEGLSPGHLKKAKLMFFFTRYPSSSLLKAYFPDVQFNRCVTSQMIKWFSNFREFYYIQMERSARQAVSDGVTDPKALVVLRDSELFRALNTHYNKGDDLEVPDCFLEIASVTLQEFFRAVSAGKDSDPSWKKPIYKIISKLDRDIPEIFKSSSYPQEPFQN